MKLWEVTGTVIGIKYLGQFKADTKEEAEEMALDSPAASVRLCHRCFSECEDPEIEKVEAEEA